MNFSKRFIIIFFITAFAVFAGSVKFKSSCDSGIAASFPFTLITKLFKNHEDNFSAGQPYRIHNDDVAVSDSTAFAAEKKSSVRVTFIELGSVNCIPCKMMQPVMKQVEDQYGSQVKVIFYDVWTAEGKPYGQKFGVRAIPTQVFLDSKGNEYFRHIGFFPFEEVEKVLKNGGVR